MADSKRNQNFNDVIKVFEGHYVKIKQDVNNQIADIKLILVNDAGNTLDDSKFSTLLVRLYRYGKYKCYKIKQEYQSGVVVLKKKSIALSSACIIGGASAFSFLFNTDFNTMDVSAEINSEDSSSTALQFPTLSINGQRFATDAKIVSKQLNSYDFYNNGKKVVYLTFDDGPTKHTPEILKILKKYNIRATFFTTGTSLENGGGEMSKVLSESYAYGNSIGNHTYSHDYKTLYPNGSLDLKAFNSDIDRNLTLLRNAIGENFNTNILRCPGGFNSWNNMDQLQSDLDKTNRTSIDWNALTGDSSNKNTDIDTMLSEAIKTSKDKNLVVLLMHETNKLTPKYLDSVIKYYHNNGYEFRTLA